MQTVEEHARTDQLLLETPVASQVRGKVAAGPAH